MPYCTTSVVSEVPVGAVKNVQFCENEICRADFVVKDPDGRCPTKDEVLTVPKEYRWYSFEDLTCTSGCGDETVDEEDAPKCWARIEDKPQCNDAKYPYYSVSAGICYDSETLARQNLETGVLYYAML